MTIAWFGVAVSIEMFYIGSYVHPNLSNEIQLGCYASSILRFRYNF